MSITLKKLLKEVSQEIDATLTRPQMYVIGEEALEARVMTLLQVFWRISQHDNRTTTLNQLWQEWLETSGTKAIFRITAPTPVCRKLTMAQMVDTLRSFVGHVRAKAGTYE